MKTYGWGVEVGTVCNLNVETGWVWVLPNKYTGLYSLILIRFHTTRRSTNKVNTQNCLLGCNLLPCKIIVDNYFTRQYIPEVVNYFTRQYIPEDNSELHTRRRENLKSHKVKKLSRQGERSYSSYSFLTSILDESGLHHAPAALYPRGKDPHTRYPLYRRLGGSQSRSGHTG
jgi:hypothetical protein